MQKVLEPGEDAEDKRHLADYGFTPDSKQCRMALSAIASKSSNGEADDTAAVQFPTTSPEAATGLRLPRCTSLILKARGLRRLYDWQTTILSSPTVREHKNIVYSLPTSAGKTLVAEVLLLDSVLERKQSGVFVVPFVALAEEKVQQMQRFADSLNFVVEGYHGVSGAFPPPKAPALYVCTIEKASSLLNRLIEDNRAGEVGVIVVDELHMVGEPQRGPTLELFLAKCLIGLPGTQLVAMSATVPNLSCLAEWLHAEPFTFDFRPVPLHQHIVCRCRVLDSSGCELRVLPAGSDTDHMIKLIEEVIPDFSVLVFCATRSQAVEAASKISAGMSRRNSPRSKQKILALIEVLNALKSSRRRTDHEIDVQIAACAMGVAYHHGGLTLEERVLIEGAFRTRTLAVVCCTSTLAAGVNLPARRVIFRSPYVAKDLLTPSRYTQMSGRAGRAGLDEAGESFLICSEADFPACLALLGEQQAPPVSSGLADDPGAVARSLLECIALKLVSSTGSFSFVSHSLLLEHCIQRNLVEDLRSALAALQEHGFVERSSSAETRSPGCPSGGTTTSPSVAAQSVENGGHLSSAEPNESLLRATAFGTSAVRSCFPIHEAIMVRNELLQLQSNGLILGDDLHVCYVLTPVRDMCTVDWVVYRQLVSRLSPIRQRIAELLGVDERCIEQRAAGIVERHADSAEETIEGFTTRRFFSALALCELLNEVPLDVVEAEFRVSRGQLQALLKSAAVFSASITNFCRAMEWHALEAVLSCFLKRMCFGVKHDILPLMEIKGVQAPRARILQIAGFKTPGDIANAEPEAILAQVKASGKDAKAAKFFTMKSAVSVVREARRLVLPPALTPPPN